VNGRETPRHASFRMRHRAPLESLEAHKARQRFNPGHIGKETFDLVHDPSTDDLH